MLTLFAEFVELPSKIKMKLIFKLLVLGEGEDHLDLLQKQIQSLSDAEAGEVNHPEIFIFIV